MTSALQNRLVGTIIIVAIAVIFLPDLLSGKNPSNKELFVELPPRPAVKTVQRPASFSTQTIKEAATRNIEIVNETALDEPAAKSPTQTARNIEDNVTAKTKQAAPDNSLEQSTVIENDEQRLLAGAGWVVQLGTFRHQKNVKELLAKLEKGGYRAFSRPVQTSSGTLTKVFVGPDLQKKRLEKALVHLKGLTDLQGRVTPFTVQ
ncbi:MAG: DedD protein [Paraglaciecola sp.]